MTVGKSGSDQKTGTYLSSLLSASTHVIIYFTSDPPDFDLSIVKSRTASRLGGETGIGAAVLYLVLP